ncbi:hypothetical protein POVWA2_084640 [Plasmodium ovale wallikeri]|uniref:Uncharacterized protein n=1 Tax=Plasmodium ovale wallikeri TaxID=864142 RepID=A0A1A9AIV2_PLAOA|nr:hypothetical protein POVWA1_074620 [Plasmodium ovale wallikeri]SBT58369.1 hypothetical protein POVWA2_084640 [Plasmodium ovale wallikeri]
MHTSENTKSNLNFIRTVCQANINEWGRGDHREEKRNTYSESCSHPRVDIYRTTAFSVTRLRRCIKNERKISRDRVVGIGGKED